MERASAESSPVLRIVPMDESMLPIVAGIHLAAFEGYMNTLLGRRYVLRFLRWFQNEPEAIALVVLDEQRPAGYVVGAPVGYQPQLTRATILAALAGVLLRPWVVLKPPIVQTAWARLRAVMRRQDGPASVHAVGRPVVYSLVGIGVAPDARGRHAGRALIEGFEATARARGAGLLRLSVYATNLDARRLYENAGWTLSGDPNQHTLYYEKQLD